ncbi:uncharacterized protein LOC130541816 isoform X6 [Ursus arctos]|uniref:uncharacterized protein LOC130541816 isoform X6 n=1 Tax=Ursus arctos TaxID=9644 RepID=UPI002546F7D6|nr:uncharacterized protein LOC130541816 isoform X6 [Ursus arctos]
MVGQKHVPNGGLGSRGTSRVQLAIPAVSLRPWPPLGTVSVTSTWRMLLMTPNPPRSQAQISTQSRNPRTAPSPGCRTTVEISTQSRNPRTAPSPGCRTTVEVSTPGRGHPLARSPVVQTAGEVTSATPTGMTAATRPDPSRPQVVAVTTPAMTGPETRTRESKHKQGEQQREREREKPSPYTGLDPRTPGS